MFLMWESNIQEGGQSLYLSLVLCVVEEVFMAALEVAVPLFKIETVEALVKIAARRGIIWATIIPGRFVLLACL